MTRFLTALSRRNLMSLLVLAVLAVQCLLLKLDAPLDALDLKISYSPERVAQVLEAQAEMGRRLYFLAECIDVFYALLYSLLFITLAARARRRRQLSLEWNAGWLMLLLPGVFDLVETIGILVLLTRFPEISPGLAFVVSVCTTMKWISIAGVAIYLTREWRRGRVVLPS